ncbi:MAG TPA: hypothetical protein VM369_00170 [Candidatus Binatia bacterium]|nr:hypothetical protein [Candidatus Binatia bacterium]
MRTPSGAAWALALLLAGCANLGGLPAGADGARQHLEFYARAMSAEAADREQMWRDVSAAAPGEDAALRRALMQGVPGHSGYDPYASMAALEGVLERKPSADVTAVARARLFELRDDNTCRDQVAALKRRLADLVNIERSLEQSGKSPESGRN